MDLNTRVAFRDGRSIPVLGLGVWNMKENTYDAVRWALDAGYRHLDCAAAYGNEEDVGRAVKDSGIPREELFITTKLSSGDVKAGNADAGIRESLARLGLDYIDLYLIHWPMPEMYVPAWQVMESYADKGVLRSIGLSNFHPRHYEILKAAARIQPVCVQLECHPQLNQQENLDYFRAEGLVMEAWSPLGGNPASWGFNAAAGRLHDRGSAVILQDPVILGLAEKYGKSAGQIILRWHLQRGVVCIPKSIHKERIIENSRIFDFALSDEDMAAIAALNCGARVGSDPETL